MAYETRKLVMAAAGGFLIAVLIISGFVWTGILPVTEAKGLLIIKVKDDPANLTELLLNISAVQVHRAGWGNETWKDIPVVATEPFDLLTLNETEKVLAVAELPLGNYTEIRFSIVSANATIDGDSEPLTIAAPWVMLKIRFTIKVPVTTVTIEIDVTSNESIQSILNAKILLPVYRATVE